MIAHTEETLDALKHALTKELELVWQQVQHCGTGEQVERDVTAWSRRIGRLVLERTLQAEIDHRERQAVPCCDGEMRREVREQRQVLTMLGAVTVWRRYFRCPRCRRHTRPVDRWLGWSGGFSFAVQELVAWECAALPYRQAVESLEKLAGLAVSLHAAEDIVARWGADELQLVAESDAVPQELVIQIDGAMTHLEEGWKEVKLGAFFAWDCHAAEPHPSALSYTAGWETAEQFRDRLWQEAQVRGVRTARATAVIGDGASWIWETAALLFPEAVQILDWYHLTEHLGVAAKAIFGEGTAETTALVEQWECAVWEGRSPQVVQHLRALVEAGKDDGEGTLRRCAGYLETHEQRLRYDLFRGAGWPVGSGVVEGGCKHVIGLRLKRQSTRWSPSGANDILHLRLDRLSRRWEHRSHLLRQTA